MAPQSWVQQVVQPADPSWTGAIVDGVLMGTPFNGTVGQFLVFENAGVAPTSSEATMMAGWGGSGFSLSRAGQGISTAWHATIRVTSSVGRAVGRGFTATGEAFIDAGQVTAAFYHQFRDECNHPLTWSANLILDIAFVGDIEDIYYGGKNGDWGEAGMGIMGIATSGIPVGKVAGVAKVALRAGDKAGDAYDLARTSERIIDPMARLAVDAANAGGDAVKEAKILKQATLLDVAKRSPVQQRGLDVLGRVEDTAVVGRHVRENVALVEFVGQLAAKKGDDAAAAATVAKFLHPDSEVSIETAAQAWSKFNKMDPGINIVDDLATLSQTPGIDGLARSAAKMAPAQAKGHAYTIQKAAAHHGAEGMHLGKSYDLAGGVLKPDEVYKLDGFEHFREFKNYNGPVSLTDFSRKQMQKYAELAGSQPAGYAEYFLKNGQATSGFLQKARDLNAFYGRDVIKVYAEPGISLL